MAMRSGVMPPGARSSTREPARSSIRTDSASFWRAAKCSAVIPPTARIPPPAYGASAVDRERTWTSAPCASRIPTTSAWGSWLPADIISAVCPRQPSRASTSAPCARSRVTAAAPPARAAAISGDSPAPSARAFGSAPASRRRPTTSAAARSAASHNGVAP